MAPPTIAAIATSSPSSQSQAGVPLFVVWLVVSVAAVWSAGAGCSSRRGSRWRGRCDRGSLDRRRGWRWRCRRGCRYRCGRTSRGTLRGRAHRRRARNASRSGRGRGVVPPGRGVQRCLIARLILARRASGCRCNRDRRSLRRRSSGWHRRRCRLRLDRRRSCRVLSQRRGCEKRHRRQYADKDAGCGWFGFHDGG